MNSAELHLAGVALSKGQIHRLSARRGHRIEALGGCLWITMDHDRRDIVVAPGESFVIDRDGDTLVSGLLDSRYLVLEPVVPRRAA